MTKPREFDQQFQLGQGLEASLVDALVDGARCIGVMNFEFSTRPGHATTREGELPWASAAGSGEPRLLRKFYVSETAKDPYFMFQRGTRLYRAPSNSTTFTLVHSGLADAFPAVAQFDDWGYFANGTNALRSSNGALWIAMGNLGASAVPTVAAFGTGSASGDYRAKFSYLYNTQGESPLSPASLTVTLANQRIRVSGMTNGPAGVTSKRIYLCSHSDFGTFYLLGSTGNNTATVWSSPAFIESDFQKAALPTIAATDSDALLLATHAGRLFFVTADDRATLKMSLPFQPGASNARHDINDVRDHDGARITGLASIGSILIVFTETATWALYGASRPDMRLERIYEVGLANGGFRTIQVINGQCYWKSRRHVYRTNGYRGGTVNISQRIDRAIESISMTDTKISNWFAIDYRPNHWYMLFVAAGSSGMTGSFSPVGSAGLGTSDGLGGISIGTGPGNWNPTPSRAEGRLCLVYDYKQAEDSGEHIWSVFSLNPLVGTTLDGPTDPGVAHLVKAASGVIRKFPREDGVPVDNTTDAINAKILWSWRGLGRQFQDKRARRLYVQARELEGSGIGYHGLGIELGGSIYTDSLPWSTQGDKQRLFLPMEATSEDMAVYTGHSSLTSRLAVEAWGLEYTSHNRR